MAGLIVIDTRSDPLGLRLGLSLGKMLLPYHELTRQRGEKEQPCRLVFAALSPICRIARLPSKSAIATCSVTSVLSAVNTLTAFFVYSFLTLILKGFFLL